MNEERWLPVVGYEGIYEISDLGRVHSLDRILSDGRRWTGKVRRPTFSSDGCLQIELSKDGRNERKQIGRLVLEAFIGPCPEHKEACHAIGSDRRDCSLAVLRWDMKGHKHSNCHSNRRLSEANIIEMRERHAAGESLHALADIFDRMHSAISNICQGKTYKHLGGPRTFGGGGGHGPLRIEAA